MIDDNLRYSGIIPDERLHDMRRDLRSPMGGGRGSSGGSGPRGAGVFLVDSVFTRSQDDTYHADKSLFLNPLDKASYGVRIGDIVLFYLNNEGILCTGVVMTISNDDVTFKKHDEISTVGFSPSIATTDIPGGHRVTVTNEGGSDSFDVMDGVQGPQGEPFEFDDFTPEQLEDLRSEIASVFYRKQEAYVTVSDVPTSVIHIPFSDYTSSSILFVDIEGLSLCENIDYVINGDDIELTSPITHANTIVNFKMLIVVALTQQDLDNIVASSVVDDIAEMVLDRFGDELPVVTYEDNGLMSSSDKIKLDGIAENANNFDTVAAMQAATDLQVDMICHTNGFHAAGDGGAAYYIINTTGTANGMDVLACADSLVATLVATQPYAMPEQFGAYGDGTHDDTVSIQAALSKYKRVKGANSYSITSIDVTGCDLELNRVGTCSIVSSGAQDQPSKVCIKYAETLTLGTFKNSMFTFGFVKTLNVAPTNSFAYNKVTYGRCNTLNIGMTGQAYWCNENQFWGRIVSGIAFLGTYGHNCNYIYCSSEGSGFTITSESAIHDNIFDLYGENVANANVSFIGYNNVIRYRYTSYVGSNRNSFGDMRLSNVVSLPTSNDLLKMVCESHIESLDQNTGLTIPAYTAYEDHLISVAENETVYIIFDSDVAGFRNQLFAYDANMQPVDLSTVFTNLTYDIANAIRQNDSEANRLGFVVNRNTDRITLPYKPEIKYWQFQVYHYTGGPFYFINTRFYSTGSKSLVSKIGTVVSST